ILPRSSAIHPWETSTATGRLTVSHLFGTSRSSWFRSPRGQCVERESLILGRACGTFRGQPFLSERPSHVRGPLFLFPGAAAQSIQSESRGPHCKVFQSPNL